MLTFGLCCGSLWGLEEMDFQSCDSCGWSPGTDPEEYAALNPEYFGEENDDDSDAGFLCNCGCEIDWEEYERFNGQCEECYLSSTFE